MNLDKLLKQIREWHNDDKHQDIIDAILQVPEDARDYILLSKLAVAYNNIGDFRQAAELLMSFRTAGSIDYLWHYRIGFSFFHLDEEELALKHFDRALELGADKDPDISGDIEMMIDECERILNNSGENSPVMYTEEEVDVVEEYILQNFGESDRVFHELMSPDIHVDIVVIDPTEEKDYYTLITMGMGAHEMNVPEELSSYELGRAELVMYLPSDWEIENPEEKFYWPMRWLKILARLPIENDTWIGFGHTVPSSETFAENTKFKCLMLIESSDSEDECAVLQLPNGDEVNFYTLVPLYDEEVEFKLQYGAEALIEKFVEKQMDYPPVLDNDRENVCLE